jgi:hypothetical protein
MQAKDWRQQPDGCWFFETPGVIWANCSHASGGFALAIVQPVGGNSSTGAFTYISQAKSWAMSKVNEFCKEQKHV